MTANHVEHGIATFPRITITVRSYYNRNCGHFDSDRLDGGALRENRARQHRPRGSETK